jgi:hypothetical protein
VESLPPIFRAAVDAFTRWSHDHLIVIDARDAITTPLYHYTDEAGLKGIITNQEVWFTDHRHLNDPTEMKFGMDIAEKILREIGDDNSHIRLFCDAARDLFSHKNMSRTFGFYIGIFTKERDDLGQWRAYACDGRGYALALAPRLFGTRGHAEPKATRDNLRLAGALWRGRRSPAAYASDRESRTNRLGSRAARR